MDYQTIKQKVINALRTFRVTLLLVVELTILAGVVLVGVAASAPDLNASLPKVNADELWIRNGTDDVLYISSAENITSDRIVYIDFWVNRSYYPTFSEIYFLYYNSHTGPIYNESDSIDISTVDTTDNYLYSNSAGCFIWCAGGARHL